MLSSREKMLQNMLSDDFRNHSDVITIELIDEILEKINSGITLKTGEIRKYDILDYYLEYKIIFRKLYDFVMKEAQNENIETNEKKILLEKAKKLLEFMNKYPIGLTQITEYVKKDILSVKDMYAVKDNNGERIPGLVKPVSKEEKDVCLLPPLSNGDILTNL